MESDGGLMSGFREKYPRCTLPDAAVRASAEFREYVAAATGCIPATAVAAPDPRVERQRRADATANRALRDLGVDVVTCSAAVAQLGAGACTSLAAWVRQQQPRSLSGLAVSILRKRGVGT